MRLLAQAWVCKHVFTAAQRACLIHYDLFIPAVWRCIGGSVLLAVRGSAVDMTYFMKMVIYAVLLPDCIIQLAVRNYRVN